MDNFWQQVYFGNSIKEWAIALGIIIVGFVFLRVIRQIVLIRLKKWAAKTTTFIGDIIIAGIEKSVIYLPG
jgi:hypothetical protein